MTYQSRIPADPEYIRAIGTAFYNFTYLEWVVIWTSVKLSANGFDSVPRRKSASVIAKALINEIDITSPPLPSSLRLKLIEFHKSYISAIHSRNKHVPCASVHG